MPLILHLYPPNPNPAKATGIFLPYWVQVNSTVQIRIYTVAGEKVRDLNSFQALAGNNEEFWDKRNFGGRSMASGIFIVRFEATSVLGEIESAYEKCALVR